MAIRASWLVLSLLLAFALVAATAMEEGSPKKEEGAPSPAADEPAAAADAPSSEEAADDGGAPAPEPASEEAEESIAAKIKAKGKTVLEGLGLSNIECKLKGNCPAPAPEASD